jgi:hypothetical protein
MSEPAKKESIGLLFVHGIGEQRRWDYLKSSIQQLSELMLQNEDRPRISVIDRTGDWAHRPGEQHPDGIAPITLMVTTAEKQTSFECHEVWWADLGARAGIGDAVTFWLWGLGQWSAPIYRELDAAGLPKEQVKGLNKPTSRYVTLPESVAGNLWTEPTSRLQLMLAGLAAAFVACSWSLAKRVFSALLGKAPSPTLIVSYVGDVRTYESRAAPGDSAMSDPGHPRRVGIRRRMVSEMVAVATRPYDGWYVVAHSLGTVLAYNGLTETGHALPNYLSEAQWQRVPRAYKRDPKCERRKDVGAMMPSRPRWLDDENVINRPKLFRNLRGLLTYGSPLDKFAGLWPRIVATGTDRTDKSSPFPKDCRWINLVAPSDPVAGTLESFDAGAGARLANAVPVVENIRTPWTIWYGLSHIKYFDGVERYAKGNAPCQKRAVAQWLRGESVGIKDHKQSRFARFFLGQFAYLLLTGALWLIATAFLVAAFGALVGLLGNNGFVFGEFISAWWAMLRPVLGAALAIILLMGVYRWLRESLLNWRLARADRDRDPDNTQKRQDYWARVIWMLGAQAWAGAVFMLLGSALVALGVALDWMPEHGGRLCAGLWRWLCCPTSVTGWWTILAAMAGIVLAAAVQTGLNRLVPPVGRAPG